MRSCLMWVLLVVTAATAVLIWPYRSERIAGVAANNRTGCVINTFNSSGYTPYRPVALWEVERLAEPVRSGVAVYECGGVVGQRPASMTLVVPDTDQKIDGCASSSDSATCYAAFTTAPPAGGAPQRYRLLIQVRPGDPVQSIDLTVTRDVEWRSGGIDALMSV